MRLNKNSEGFGIVGILIVVLVFVLVAGTGWYVISKNSSSNNSNSGTLVNNSNGTAKSEPKGTASVSKQTSGTESNSSTTNSTTSNQQPTQEDLDLTVDKATTANTSPGNPSPYYGIAIKLTLKNSTNSPITEGPTNYQIKDANNNVYALHFSDSGGFGKDYLPIGVQEIQPGQSVTGSIFIQIADANITNYTLFIGSHSYKVAATKLASYPASD